MSYVKLDCRMLNSSIWPAKDQRDVFITALLMARPAFIEEAVEALCSDTLEKLGFVVQPGWYGFVDAAGPGILASAGVGGERGRVALVALSMQDNWSSTPGHEGRRMVRVPGGYVILNYFHYREKDHTSAERSKRYRDKKAGKDPRPAPPTTRERNMEKGIPPIKVSDNDDVRADGTRGGQP